MLNCTDKHQQPAFSEMDEKTIQRQHGKLRERIILCANTSETDTRTHRRRSRPQKHTQKPVSITLNCIYVN